MAVEIATAYVQLVPSARGLAASISKELAPAQGLAQKEGAKAGTGFGNRFGGELKKTLPKEFLGINFGALLGAAAVAGIGVALLKIGEDFQKVRHQIEQETGATGHTLTALFDTVKREALKVPASFGDITTAVDELQRRGVPLGATLDKLAEQELFLAKITKTDLSTNVEAITGLFAKFNVPLRDQSREMDVLFKATQASGKGLNDLIEPLVKGATNLQQFGFDLDHATALVAGLAKAGVQVAPVLASLRKAFGQIAKEGKDPQTVLRAIVKELRDGKDPTKAMADAIKLFGNRGGAELARAIQQGKLSVDGLLKSITNGKDGIVATGVATETLGDKFLLLKNRALVSLEPIGTAVLKVFEDAVAKAGPIFGNLLNSISHFATAALPLLIPVGLAAEGMFKAALPILAAFGAGLDAVASVLTKIPTPVLVAAGALGLLAAGFAALKLALVTGAISSFLADLNPATATLVVTAAAVTALGAVMSIFGKNSNVAKAEAKDLGKALFDASSDATIFAANIGSATSGVEAFLRAQIQGGKADFLRDILGATSTTVSQLSTHLSTGQKSWDAYTKQIAKSVLESSGVTEQQNRLVNVSGKVIKTLNDQREAFQLSAQAELATVVANGQLKQSDLNAIEARHKNSDGTLKYGEVLDAVNKKLGILAKQTDDAAQATAQSSPIYKVLVDQFASGSISADDFAAVLKDKFKFSVDGAKAAAKDLTAQIKGLGDEVDKSFPAIADAAKGLSNNMSGVAADLAGRQSTFARQLAVSESLGSGASKKLRDNISTNLKGIRDDFKVLAADTDPEKFTANLLKQIQSISTFFANIKILVQRGFPELARSLLDMGAQAGGSLAAGFVAKPTIAKNANAAESLLAQTKGAAKQWVLDHFAELSGIGGSVADGVAAGIDANAQHAITSAVHLIDGVKHVMGSAIRQGSPSRWARDEIGKNIVLGLAQGLDPAPLEAPTKKLFAGLQKSLSKPLVIGAAFQPNAFTSDRLASSLQATRPFDAAAAPVPTVSIGAIYPRDANDTAREIDNQQRRARLLSTL